MTALAAFAPFDDQATGHPAPQDAPIDAPIPLRPALTQVSVDHAAEAMCKPGFSLREIFWPGYLPNAFFQLNDANLADGTLDRAALTGALQDGLRRIHAMLAPLLAEPLDLTRESTQAVLSVAAEGSVQVEGDGPMAQTLRGALAAEGNLAREMRLAAAEAQLIALGEAAAQRCSLYDSDPRLADWLFEVMLERLSGARLFLHLTPSGAEAALWDAQERIAPPVIA